MHGIGVHQPGHGLGVGVDARGGDFTVWSDQDRDLGRVAPRQPLQLAKRHLLRIADYAALSPAVWNLDAGALPGHPHRERLDLVEIHGRVVPNTALGRAASDVVLDAKTGEDSGAAVVELDREMHDQLPLGITKHLTNIRAEVELVGRAVVLLQRHLEWRLFAWLLLFDLLHLWHDYLPVALRPATELLRANQKAADASH